MVTEFLKYLLFSGIGIALFYLIDIVLLRKSTLFRARRWYHITALSGSLLLPLLALWIPTLESIKATTDLPHFTIMIDEVNVTDTVATSSPSWNWMQIALLVWGIGAVVIALWLASGFISLNKLRHRAIKKRVLRGVTLYFTDREVAPFTIGHHIFIPHSLIDNSQLLTTILSHELEHIRQRHYRDIAISMVLQPIQWWNPCMWSLLQQQRTNLEYLADQGVLRRGTLRKTYQYHLLECTAGRSVELPSLTFSMQNLKNRIKMMNNKKQTNKRVSLLYAIVALPVVALLLIGTQFLTVKEVKANPATTNEVAPPPTEEHIFEYLEDMPEFPGGSASMMTWLSSNIQYPQKAIEDNAQGRVIVSFVVEKDGSISNVKVIRSVHEALDTEAVRLVSSMPHWKPGKQDGEAVRARFNLPVQFSMTPKEPENSTEPKTTPAKEGEIFQYLDDMPEFPGGGAKMMEWISTNIQYPKEAAEQKIEGRVMASFIVEADGSVTNAKIERSINEALDAEALRVINSMPKWTPGKKDGEAVRARFTIPVNFRLTTKETKAPAETTPTTAE